MLTICRITRQQHEEAFSLMRELRSALEFEAFVARLERQQQHGYELHGAIENEIVGLIGFRDVETMARGPHIHVDDLVISKAQRSAGIGRKLMEYVESIASEKNLGGIFLDSRLDVVDFYKGLGYEFHKAQLMCKRF
ncbi:GNAT family N-acetyltransferase [Spartinivicinus ruber]|uniref:GNAT family N-acetyltransferase n=1 Tax=Spartinivicinus ruber TaxID=2683272 RepID=UPI0013D1586B|nr:GNAT family N-acetyltransferase [Spartinivicinus ruber]